MKIVRGIVVYDISSAKFRKVLEKSLKDYGRRVQLSVFEFSLEEKTYKKMIKQIRKVYDLYSGYKVENLRKPRKKSIIVYKINLLDENNKICFDQSELTDVNYIELII